VTSINSLHPDHKNARRRTDRSASLIADSLKQFGAARSIVIDEDNRILAGNGTVEGAKLAGIKNVRIIETDGTEVIAVKRTGLTEEEKVSLAIGQPHLGPQRMGSGDASPPLRRTRHLSLVRPI